MLHASAMAATAGKAAFWPFQRVIGPISVVGWRQAVYTHALQEN
jgi:hypothetical protein